MPSDAPAALPFSACREGVRLMVRLSPGSGRDGFDGLKPTASGGCELCVRVTEAPERGRANKALIALLAKEWKLPKRSLSITSGETDRHKVVLIEGEAHVLVARLDDWLRSETL